MCDRLIHLKVYNIGDFLRIFLTRNKIFANFYACLLLFFLKPNLCELKLPNSVNNQYENLICFVNTFSFISIGLQYFIYEYFLIFSQIFHVFYSFIQQVPCNLQALSCDLRCILTTFSLYKPLWTNHQ